MRDYILWQAVVLAVNFLAVIGYEINSLYEGSGYDSYPNGYYDDGGWETDHYEDWYGLYCFQEVCRFDKPKCCYQHGQGKCCSKDEYDYLRRSGKTRCLGSLNIIYTGVSCPTAARPDRFLCCPHGNKCCTQAEYRNLDKKHDNTSKREHSSSGIPFQGPMVGIVTIIVVMVGAAIAILSRFIKSRKNRRHNIPAVEADTTNVQDPPPPYPLPYQQAAALPGVCVDTYRPCVDVMIEDTPPEYNDVINPPPAYVTDYESSAESTTSKRA